MSKKSTRREKIALQEEQRKIQPAKKDSDLATSNLASNRTLALVIAALAFLLYANTLGHSWALDDFSIIKENSMTRKGIAALGEIFSTTYRSGYVNLDFSLYRPLAKTLFAIEWQFRPDSPFVGHFVNASLYAVTGVLLFTVLKLYFKENVLAAFLASLLFVAHPIHTEVVANIKSLDEILSLLFFLSSLIFLHRYLDKGGNRVLAFALGCFFLSLLSKESAVTFTLVIPLMIWFCSDTKRSRTVFITMAFAAVMAVFLLIRMSVISTATRDLMDPGGMSVLENVMGGLTVVQRFPTAVFVMGLYAKLLVFPHPLVSDYSFNQIPVVGFGDVRFLMSLAIYTGLLAFALLRIKRKDPIAFALLFFFITASVASNMVFLIGTTLGERLMYTPSVGFCIAIAFLLSRLVKNVGDQESSPNVGMFFKRNLRPLAVAAVILVLGASKTIARNADWHDNLTLYTADLKNSANSARLHYNLGDQLSLDDFIATLGNDSSRIASYQDAALKELSIAAQIYPEYADAYQQMGKVYVDRKEFAKAEEYYRKALAINPYSPLFLSNYGHALFNMNRFDEAKKQFEEAIRWNPTYGNAYHNLANVYGSLGDIARSNLNEGLADENYRTAITNFKKAIECDPEYAPAYRFLGLTYRNIGDENAAKFYLDKATQLDNHTPSIR